MIYNSLIQSHLSYCQVIWCNAKKKILDPLIKAQKRALRIVNSEHWLKHCDPLFASMGCLKLTDQFKVSCGKLVVKYLYDTLPPGLSDCFEEKVQVRTTRLTENNRLLTTPRTNDPNVLKLPKFNIAEIWNKHVPTSIKEFPEACFVESYKSLYMLEYNNFKCSKSNCYSCESRFIR